MKQFNIAPTGHVCVYLYLPRSCDGKSPTQGANEGYEAGPGEKICSGAQGTRVEHLVSHTGTWCTKMSYTLIEGTRDKKLRIIRWSLA